MMRTRCYAVLNPEAIHLLAKFLLPHWRRIIPGIAGLASIAAPSLAFCQPVPWVLPWNDSLSGVITDFSRLNPPIGNNWVLPNANGHFVLEGERVRFLGVNFAGDSPFTPTNNADAVAGRLAKFGMNCVRFHHMDAPWSFGGGLINYGTTSTNLRSAPLDALHYLIWRLKTHGIYSDINLLTGREYRANDGLGAEVVTMDQKDAHILACFYPPALALHQDFATKLLGATNRYTGLPLAKDPAVAFVEILNENGLLQKWLDGGLDRLPSRYATNLQSRWNHWLAGRYTDDATLLSAWNVIQQPLSTNLIVNGAFSNGLTGWTGEQHDTARAHFSRTFEFTGGAPSARIAVTNPDGVGWHIQFNYPGLRLVTNQAYSISFWAKASVPANVGISVMQAHADWQGLGYGQNVALTTNWRRFTNVFQANQTDSNARVNFGDMGNQAATFWFADVRLQSGGELGAPPGGLSLAARNLPNIRYSGTGYTGTQNARRDWIRFLRDLETAYYAAMTAHLRTNLGYPGMIVGTIMANSPATVQAGLDAIDGHAYWQHPTFPGTAWDMSNWHLQNISMVNTLGDNTTLAGLARQRIQGKPFTVTEYQHSSPNYYGAEGPLLLAAYAGLQDWDGLWLFDYGGGSPTIASMGKVNGFFDIGQHPTKMPNLLIAANLFRRGDVQPARQEYTMAFTPEQEVETLLNTWAWGLFSSSQLGMPAKLPFVSRVSTAVGVNPPGLTTPPTSPAGNSLTSDTGELRWDASMSGKGLVTFNTLRSKGLIGFADNQAVNLGGVTLKPGTTKLGWCTVAVTLQKGEVITNDCSALIVATGWWENTGQVWTDTNRVSLGTKWGASPVLAEVVPFTLTLPVSTNHVRLWSLDERGQRKVLLPLSGNDTATTINVTTNTGSLWYELEVSRWTASFDLWRLRYFSSDGLPDPAVSSPAAMPDHDGIPNWWKYYAGLPGGTPANRDRLPMPNILQLDTNQYLALSFTRDRLATDLSCVGEVSSNLLAWWSGPTHAKVETVTDLGALERVTIRDQSPIGLQPSRYLRLRLQSNPP
jgi:hypothetical protein